MRTMLRPRHLPGVWRAVIIPLLRSGPRGPGRAPRSTRPGPLGRSRRTGGIPSRGHSLRTSRGPLLLGAFRARSRHIAADPERPDDDLGHGRIRRGSVLGGVVFAGRVHVPLGHTLVPAEVALRTDVIEDRIVPVGVLNEEDLVGAALLELLRLRPDVLPAEHCARHAGGGA